jgi:hypothetical protein
VSDRQAVVNAMYAMYCSGKSLAQVASAFHSHRQNVYDTFRRRGLELRSPNFKPFIMYRGEKFTLNDDGYYSRTRHGNRGDRTLHRLIWTEANGPIPDGYEIHHEDRDKTNNDLSNLRCLPKPEHSRIPKKVVPERSCLQCGATLVRGVQPSGKWEPPVRFVKRSFCNSQCCGAWKRARPRTERVRA